MKKTIICGIASLAMATAPVFSAFAESPQAGSSTSGNMIGTHDVTVGEVDETVYSVDINWGDMIFDWKYAKDINKFGLEPSRSCMSETYQHGDYIPNKRFANGILYSDPTCSVVLEEEPADGTEVYSKSGFENYLTVSDNSTNGKVKVSAAFSSEEKYNWVTGEFMKGGYWTDGPSISIMNIPRENYSIIGEDIYYYYDESLTDGNLVESTSFPGVFYAQLVLRTDSEADLSSIDIEPEDKIGTITLNIEPDLN